MRASMVYFAGVGTVVVAIGAGLGGGLLIANVMNPHSLKQGAETTKLERRMSAEAIPAANAPAEPVPYLATQPPAGPAIAAAPKQSPQTQTEAANPPPSAAQPAQPTVAADTAGKPPEAQPSQQPQAPTARAAIREQTAAPDNAFAKARDADLKRAAEKRKAERRQQQWADRRRYEQRKDQEPQDSEQSVREETAPRQFIERPVRLEFPRIRMFGRDDDDEQ
jgi:hypothetical protein